MPLNIVLVHPEIPNNTGNIGRLALAAGAKLHLIQPFGFELSDKRVKRAGLDYWQHLDLEIHTTTADFFNKYATYPMAFFSSKAKKSYLEVPFQSDSFLIFGKESKGLPIEVITEFEEQLYKIPLNSPYVRSLNLANAVSIVVYEGLRQLG